MNPYLLFILIVLVGGFLAQVSVEYLNLRASRLPVPDSLRDVFDEQRYQKSQSYLRETTRLGLIRGAFFLSVTIGAIGSGFFEVLDQWVRAHAQHEITRGLLFVGILGGATKVISLPFSLYATFGIEERYGFNRTTPGTYITDLVRGTLLAVVLGGSAFSLAVWFFYSVGPSGWLPLWLALTLFQIFLMFIAPVVIAPMFNKFKPLEEGELKTEVEKLAGRENFPFQGLYTMDGSKRSTKSNAYFTGFGKFRRIVFFDTLIAKHTTAELVAVLAHEIGHYQERHIFRMTAFSILASALVFFTLSRFLANPGLFEAFGMSHLSIYAGLVFVGFLYSPVSKVFSLAANAMSRRHEFQADAYSARTFGQPEKLVSALKKLSADHLANLTPHPWKVWADYTHPPVAARIAALRAGTTS